MVEDVILGCAMPEAEQGMNVARQASWLGGFRKKLPQLRSIASVHPGFRRSRLLPSESCAAGLDCIVAGGTETMSLIPMGGHKIVPNPTLVETMARLLLEHGTHGREPRAEVFDLARGGRRVLTSQPSESNRSYQRPASSKMKLCRSK